MTNVEIDDEEDDWEAATGAYIGALAGNGTWHVVRTVVQAALISPEVREIGSGGFEPGLYTAVCGKKVWGLADDNFAAPFCRLCLRSVDDLERARIEHALAAATQPATSIESSLTFVRSGAGRRRHLCDWTGTAVCGPETRLKARPETERDDARDEWCFVCIRVVDSFVRTLIFFREKREWHYRERPSVAESRLRMVAEAAGPTPVVAWLTAAGIEGSHAWVFHDAYPSESWESWALRRGERT